MQIFHSLQEFPHTQEPIALTLGSFDGVHLGHRAVLQELQRLVPQGKRVVISFSNHPSSILRPKTPVELLCTLPHRCKLLEEAGMDCLILLQFTPELANHSFEEFLRSVHSFCPFKYLVLGHDAAFGKERKGTQEAVQKLTSEMHFALDYLKPFVVEETPVSSSTIRTALREGDLSRVEKLLGRPFSISQDIQSGQGLGKRIGFPTLNIPVEELCLPPLGVYAVLVKQGSKTFKAVANLGIAPTVRTDRKPLLEVYLLEGHLDESLAPEVLFHTFLRTEQRFASIDALKEQIARDVQQTKEILK